MENTIPAHMRQYIVIGIDIFEIGKHSENYSQNLKNAVGFSQRTRHAEAQKAREDLEAAKHPER